MWVQGLQTNARAYCLQFSVIVFPVSLKNTRTNDREVKFKRTIRIWEILESFCIVDMRSVLFCYLKFNATLVRFEPFVGIDENRGFFYYLDTEKCFHVLSKFYEIFFLLIVLYSVHLKFIA